MEDWKALFVAGLGGGALYEITDQLVGKMIPVGQIAGVSLKDIALIYLAKHFSEKTAGDWSIALKGMAAIGIYKVIYPQFVKPLLSGLFPGAAPPAAPPVAPTALTAAQQYVLAKWR